MNKNTIKKLKSFLTKSSKKSIFYVHEPHLEKKTINFCKSAWKKMKSRLLVFMKKN